MPSASRTGDEVKGTQYTQSSAHIGSSTTKIPIAASRFAAASLGQLEVVTQLTSRPAAHAADDG
jgi:hypothetical protein